MALSIKHSHCTFSSTSSFLPTLDILHHYERDWKDITSRFFTFEAWPSISDISGLFQNRTFLSLYRILYYKHMLTKLASDERPAALSTYFEAYHAYKEFFDLTLISDNNATAGTEATSPFPSHMQLPGVPATGGATSDIVLPAVWIYDLVYDFVYFYERFSKRRSLAANAANAAASAKSDATDEKVNVEESTASESNPVPPTIAVAAAAAETQISEEKLSTVWQLPEVMLILHRIVNVSEIRDKLADGAHIAGFKDLAGYYTLIMLCRTYTKLSDYGAAIQYAQELGVQSQDGLFSGMPKVHTMLVLYSSFSLLMSRRFEDALRVISRSVSFMHRCYRVLDDRDGGNTGFPPSSRVQVKKMLFLAAVAYACCPGIEVDDIVRKTLNARHRDLIDALQSGGLASVSPDSAEAQKIEAEILATVEAAAKTAASAAEKAALESGIDEADAVAIGETAGAAAKAEALIAARSAASPADLLLNTAFAEFCPGFLPWNPTTLLNTLKTEKTEKDSSASPAPPTESMFDYQRGLFRTEVSQRTAGKVAQLRSYLRLYTSIDVPKLASYTGLSSSEVRAALVSMKVKSWSGGEPSFFYEGSGGDSAGLDALHFYLSEDLIEVEEYRQPANAAMWFLGSIERLDRCSRELGRSERAQAQLEAGNAAAQQRQHQQQHQQQQQQQQQQQHTNPEVVVGFVGEKRAWGLNVRKFNS